MNAEMEGSGRMRTRVHDSSNHPFPGQFDIVDIDPYGTPMPFLDTGLESVKPGGLLAVTATDMAVLAGPGKVTCGERYSAVPLRGYLSREAGLRILLATVARHAQRLNLDLAPVLSIISGYYVRVVVRVTESRWGGQEAHPAVNTLPFEGYTGPPLPTRNRVGPMWTGPLHDAGFVRNIPPLSNPGCGLKRFEMFLGTLKTEARVDVLFYYETGELARRLHLESPPRRDAILDSLKEGGYSAARTHASASGWRTNAPPEVVDSIVRSLDLHFP
jgi:tRNA (guanine26-N2/guanine27-N2)-dimethyltransferase